MYDEDEDEYYEDTVGEVGACRKCKRFLAPRHIDTLFVNDDFLHELLGLNDWWNHFGGWSRYWL
jgi:hypothetical protein